MIVSRATRRIVIGLCLAGACAWPARAATDDSAPADRGRLGGAIGENPAAPRERPVTGNPLWAIPLGSLSVTRERPLFTPSRRPPAPPQVVVPQAPPVRQVVRPPEPEHPNLALVGTVVGETESIGVFLDPATQRLVRLKTGEGHSGWILQAVRAREATLVKGGQSEILSLPTMQQPPPPSGAIEITR